LQEKRLRVGVFAMHLANETGTIHSAPELKWFDTAQGRRVIQASGRQLTSSPATNATILEILTGDMMRLRDDR
jgi:hypothetical protein